MSKTPTLSADLIVQQGIRVASLLREISEATEFSSMLKPVAGVSLLIMETTRIVKANKEDCLRMADRICEIINVIINLCHETHLDPNMINNIARLTETLQKVLSFMRAQAGSQGSFMKRLVHHVGNAATLADCKASLDSALRVFEVQMNVSNVAKMAEMQRDIIRRHEEIVNLVTDNGATGLGSGHYLQNSSSSILSLIPANPKIFYGRETEQEHVLSAVTSGNPARVAILGPGGIGKSTLALSLLHHPKVVKFFQRNRHFVPCDSADTPTALTSLIAMHFNISIPQRGTNRIAKAIVQYFKELSQPALLILDNFESPWEPASGRAEVEEFLSILTELDNVNLVITLRGAERPHKILWSRPFLPPLNPLSSQAAQQIFSDICDVGSESEGAVAQLLKLTDNLPLAVSLMAHSVSYEGFDSVLARWKVESTSLLSDGLDKRSNLDTSIMMSVRSPRIESTEGARDLLSLLSILPDGMSNAVLEELNSSDRLGNVAKARVALTRTCLAYQDQDGRLKVLVPIREFMLRSFAPNIESVRPVRNALFSLVEMYDGFESSQASALVKTVAEDVGNLHALIRYCLENEAGEEQKASLYATIHLSAFTRVTDLGSYDILWSLQSLVDQSGDLQLKGEYYLALSKIHDRRDMPFEEYASQAVECFQELNNTHKQAEALYFVGVRQSMLGRYAQSRESCEMALQLARQAGDIRMQSNVLLQYGINDYLQGKYFTSLEEVQDSLELSRQTGNLLREAQCNRHCALVRVALGNYKQAAQHCEEAKRLLSALGLDITTYNLYRDVVRMEAEVYLQRTEYAAARQFNETVAASANALDSERVSSNQAYAILNLVYIDLLLGEYQDPQVAKRLEFCTQAFTILHDVRALGFCEVLRGTRHILSREYETAEEVLRKNLKVVFSVDAELTIMCYEKLGDAALATQNIRSATKFYTLFLVMAAHIHDAASTLQALRSTGDLFIAEGDEETAFNIFNAALVGFDHMDIHRGRGDCLLRVGNIERRRGNILKARECWEKALDSFARCPLAEQVERCQTCLDETAM